MHLRLFTFVVCLLALTLIVSSCGPQATPTATTVPNTPVPATVAATSAPTAQATIQATAATTQAATQAATQALLATSAATMNATLAATTAATTLATAITTTVATSAATASITVSIASGSTPASTLSASGSPQHTFVIGDVGSTPTQSIATFQPLADYLMAKLAPAGITSVTIKVAPDFDTVAKWLKSGEIDMLFQTPYPVILLQDAVGAQPILRRWKDGDSEYSSVIFARADTGMKTLADLKGKMLAVQDEFSTSAYMMPLAYAVDAGFKIAKKDTPTAAVAPDEIGFTNSSGDDNTLQWVISGKVAAGTTDIRHYNALPEDSRKQLVILAQTENIPRGVVVVRPGMDDTLLATLKSVLVAMDQSDDGKAVLVKIQKTNRFDELPGGAAAALSDVRKLTNVLKGALGK